MKITQEQINNATYEAIFWWNRDEFFYHQYFSKFPEIYTDKKLLSYFKTKIFDVFLREYSIRRNLSSGYKSVDNFIDELFENNFFKSVNEGHTNIIDTVSEKLKSSENSKKRHTRSLLSKVAFLVNPKDFSLYDNLAKQSLWDLKKASKTIKFNDLENYSGFLKQTNLLILELRAKKLFDSTKNILNQFKDTSAHTFFHNQQDIFERRITDKFLWLLAQLNDSRVYEHDQYIELNRI